MKRPVFWRWSTAESQNLPRNSCGGSPGRSRGRVLTGDPVDMRSSLGGPGRSSFASDKPSGDRGAFSYFTMKIERTNYACLRTGWKLGDKSAETRLTNRQNNQNGTHRFTSYLKGRSPGEAPRLQEMVNSRASKTAPHYLRRQSGKKSW